jgi:hypothetical protein
VRLAELPRDDRFRQGDAPEGEVEGQGEEEERGQDEEAGVEEAGVEEDEASAEKVGYQNPLRELTSPTSRAQTSLRVRPSFMV